MSTEDSVFQPSPGMGASIFHNKYALPKKEGEDFETWAERLEQVVDGNMSLVYDVEALKKISAKGKGLYDERVSDYKDFLRLAKKGVIAMSGRHLQHGMPGQREHKNGEHFTNCSTAMSSALLLFLLMKGSGVGRSYDNDITRVDWDFMPDVRLVLESPDYMAGTSGHPDYEEWIEPLSEAREKYPSNQDGYRWFDVEDSAEGWVKVIEVLETAAYQKKHKDKLFIFNFTNVRPNGASIKGQQGRPSSGPIPLIKALSRVASLKGAGMAPWKQAMWVDHYLADAVRLGGIRRSARIATKYWKDSGIFDFISIKRGGNLWSANNSVLVDAEFWEQHKDPRTHAFRVYNAIMAAQYLDGTGEPGIINIDNLKFNRTRLHQINKNNIFSKAACKLLKMHPKTLDMHGDLLEIVKNKKYPYIVNPCAEIVLALYGAYCIIGDLNLAFVDSIEEAILGARMMTQSLVRVNTMEFLYEFELKRTNRIGVGITGIHEFAYKHYNASVVDLINDPDHKFWSDLVLIREAAEKEADSYSHTIGLSKPHTVATIKPSGTISKVLGVTEGAHPPAFGTYMRWVQMKIDDPQLQQLVDKGYPTIDVSAQYSNTYVVGYPTKPTIVDYAGEKLVLAGEMTIEQHFKWLHMLENSWLGGRGNQISYTVKYSKEDVSWEKYTEVMSEYVPNVRCYSVMPQLKVDESKYAYLPEQPCTLEEYNKAMDNIKVRELLEAYDPEELACEGGACPIEPDRYVE